MPVVTLTIDTDPRIIAVAAGEITHFIRICGAMPKSRARPASTPIPPSMAGEASCICFWLSSSGISP